MKKAYRTVFDRSALAGASIIVSGGRIGYQIELAPEELIRLARAEDVYKRQEVGAWIAAQDAALNAR